MTTPRMYLDVPGEGYGHASYPYFDENDRQHLSIPLASMVLAVQISTAAKLESFFDGSLVDSRELQAGDQKIPLAELVPFRAGEAYFQVSIEGGETTRSTVYVFLDDYFTGYQAYRDRDYKRKQERDERRRLAAACPPPVAPATYQDLIDEQLRLAAEAAVQAGQKLTEGSALSLQAATASSQSDQDVDSIFAKVTRVGQEAARLIERAKLHASYARYYREEKETTKS